MHERKPGYAEIARINGIPILFHWTFPVGGLVPALFVGFRVEQSIYFCIGYVLLVGVHELGHVLAARFHRLDVLAVEISGFGGLCWTQSPKSLQAALLLFSGGLLAQLALLFATVAFIAIFGRPPSLFLNCVAFMFTFANALILVANVVPTHSAKQPTDGFFIWQTLKAPSPYLTLVPTLPLLLPRRHAQIEPILRRR